MTFLWGAATAGHQIEGNNTNADIWLLEQVKDSGFLEPSGDACDSLHRWGDDMALVRTLGLNAFRFSVEWSRVEPSDGRFSQAWLDHYRNIALTCQSKGVFPVVTLSHFTSPRWFAAAGGWGHPHAADRFARFAGMVAHSLGDCVGHVVTFNEPNLPLMGRWTGTPIADPARVNLDAMLNAAAHASGSDRFAVWVYSRGEHLANLLAGHRAARAAWKTLYPRALIGMSLAVPDTQAVGTDTGVVAYRSHAENPFFAEAQQDDFIGIQTYGRLRMDAVRVLPVPEGTERTQSGDEYYPTALGNAVRHAHAATGRPVFVTENGIAAGDDRQRARYIVAALTSLDRAQADGIPVLGYLHWSLLDNFEWRRGYSQQFGLATVDRRTFRRALKPSALVYRHEVRRRLGT